MTQTAQKSRQPRQPGGQAPPRGHLLRRLGARGLRMAAGAVVRAAARWDRLPGLARGAAVAFGVAILLGWTASLALRRLPPVREYLPEAAEHLVWVIALACGVLEAFRRP